MDYIMLRLCIWPGKPLTQHREGEEASQNAEWRRSMISRLASSDRNTALLLQWSMNEQKDMKATGFEQTTSYCSDKVQKKKALTIYLISHSTVPER
jgi:hypothetical protein